MTIVIPCQQNGKSMITNIDNSHRGQVPPNAGTGHQVLQRSAQSDQAASLEVRYDALIAQALDLAQPQADAIERARVLIASGQLDTPANIRQAAQEIIDLGP